MSKPSAKPKKPVILTPEERTAGYQAGLAKLTAKWGIALKPVVNLVPTNAEQTVFGHQPGFVAVDVKAMEESQNKQTNEG